MSHPNPNHDPENEYPEDITLSEALSEVFNDYLKERVNLQEVVNLQF